MAKAITINPIIKPSEILSNAILADLRDRKKWEDVSKTVKCVTNVRKISNEKIKMVKKLQPSSKGFPGVEALQPYLAEKDRFLMYEINENSQYVFKTSLEKMKFPKSMHRNNNTYMSSEYCFFDGNHTRVKNYVTLTATAYHPLLCKQAVLVTMQSKQEDKENIEIFWGAFNKAYKEANNEVTEKFHPSGWCTDMTSCNFIGLVKIYGEDVLQYIKGCEFYFRDSVNQHANKFGDESETFKKYALQFLTSSTPEAYGIFCLQLKSFINTTTNTETFDCMFLSCHVRVSE